MRFFDLFRRSTLGSYLFNLSFICLLALGGAVGGGALFQKFGRSQASATLVYNSEVLADFIDLGPLGPKFVASELVTPGFAQKVGNLVSNAAVSDLLPARQYGGLGGLTARINGSGNSMQINVSVPTSVDSVAIVAAVVDIIIKSDTELTERKRAAAQIELSFLLKLQSSSYDMISFIDSNIGLSGFTDRHISNLHAATSMLLALNNSVSELQKRISRLDSVPPVVSYLGKRQAVLGTSGMFVLVGCFVGVSFAVFLLAVGLFKSLRPEPRALSGLNESSGMPKSG